MTVVTWELFGTLVAEASISRHCHLGQTLCYTETYLRANVYTRQQNEALVSCISEFINMNIT